MRTIKYRIQRTNGQWEYFILPKDSFKLSDVYFHQESYKMDTFAEFTGLLDKPEKEIYEGDIVKTIISNYEGKIEKERIGHIGYNDKKGCFYLEYLDERYGFKEGRNLTKESFEDFEIIGNIYENPELLTTN